MNSKPLVSIIIPNRNHRIWLGDCIQSCLRQTFRNIEIIVVDDASTDQSCEFLQQKFSGVVRLIRLAEHQGPAAARNIGFLASRGEYIQFLDADDFIAGEKIERQLGRILETGADICAGDWRNCYSLKKVNLLGPVIRVREDTDFLEQTIIDRDWLPLMALLIRRDVLERTGPWREDLPWNEDREYRYRLMRQNPQICHTPGTFFYYRDHCRGKRSHLENQQAAAKTVLKVRQLFIEELLLPDYHAGRFRDTRTLEAVSRCIRDYAHMQREQGEIEYQGLCRLADSICMSASPAQDSAPDPLSKIVFRFFVRLFFPRVFVVRLRRWSVSFELLFHWAQSWYGAALNRLSRNV